jgi:hypothetical protein
MKISVVDYWVTGGGLDLSAQCRNWTQDKTGAQRRMGNRATALDSLGWAINHLAAKQARPIAGQPQTEGRVGTDGASTLYHWSQLYTAPNAINRVVRAVCLPRRSGTGDATMSASGGAASGNYNTTIASPSWPEDLFLATMTDDDDAPDNDHSEETLTTANGFTIVDFVIQDRELDVLDTAVHEVARRNLAIAGQDLLADQFEELRGAFHEIRTRNMGVEICWLAQGTSTGWAGTADLPSGGDHRGIWVTSTSYVNLLDQAVTSRTATSRGVSCSGYACGMGPNDYVWLRCSAFGLASAAGAYVKFIGPARSGANECEIEIPTGTPAWADVDAACVLNTTVGDDDTTTARNKVDIHGKVASEGDNLIVYGLMAEKFYDFPTLPT